MRWLQVWWRAVLLGIATIGAYGTAYYAFGALIPAIHEDTGWAKSSLTLAVALSTIGQGALALIAGRVLDGDSSRLVLRAGTFGGSLVLLASSLAGSAWQFVALWTIGSSLVGGCLYYNVTMPIASRLYPQSRASALSVLTLLGALASPIFYPLVGLLLANFDWQTTLRVLAVVTLVLTMPAALAVRVQHASPTTVVARVSAATHVEAIPTPVFRLLVVVAVAGFANSTVLLHQVPAMEAAGLSVGMAATLAGVRGLFQIPGRLLLTPITRRLGTRNSVLACYVGGLASCVALLLALNVSTAIVGVFVFCGLGGMSLGMLSPLNGLFQTEVFGNERLGMLSGVTVCVASISSALGSLTSGFVLDWTGSYQTTVGTAVCGYLLTLLALAWQGQTRRASERRKERAAV